MSGDTSNDVTSVTSVGKTQRYQIIPLMAVNSRQACLTSIEDKDHHDAFNDRRGSASKSWYRLPNYATQGLVDRSKGIGDDADQQFDKKYEDALTSMEQAGLIQEKKYLRHGRRCGLQFRTSGIISS